MKKNKSVRGLILISLMSLVPLAALAAAGSEVTTGINTFGSIINTITQSIVRSLATLFATAAMAAFFFGIVQFIWGTRDGDATKTKNGKNFMLWGLIALFVMFSVWGIVIYTQKIFGIQGQNTIIIPDIKIQGSGSTPTPSPLGTGGTASGTAKPNGWSCTSNSGCSSGYCDPSDNVCTAVPGVTGGGGVSGGNSNEPYGYCPDGSPYYSASDAKFCASGASNSDGINCNNITDAETCGLMRCSWSDSERECSR